MTQSTKTKLNTALLTIIITITLSVFGWALLTDIEQGQDIEKNKVKIEHNKNGIKSNEQKLDSIYDYVVRQKR